MPCAGRSVRGFNKKKQFFFEKKNQKTFVLGAMGVVATTAHAPGAKFFCFFFSKKRSAS
jgi:hypothetical protein